MVADGKRDRSYPEDVPARNSIEQIVRLFIDKFGHASATSGAVVLHHHRMETSRLPILRDVVWCLYLVDCLESESDVDHGGKTEKLPATARRLTGADGRSISLPCD